MNRRLSDVVAGATLFFALLIVACDRESQSTSVAPATRFPAVQRIVAFGDVHGDLAATLSALRLAGAIDESSHWIGRKLVVVQTGDQLDRGDQERAILDLFQRLALEAQKAGGAFHALNGNHEIMNVMGDLRYVTPRGFEDFSTLRGLDLSSPAQAHLPTSKRPRATAFLPGGPFARVLAKRNTTIIVGENVFAHGGVLPEHVDYGLLRINREVSAWMRGELDRPPDAVLGDDGVVWTRAYSLETDTQDCASLELVLQKLGARRMIVGHTVQRTGISSACNGKVWRIDTGMAECYGGRPAVLEITKSGTRIIR